ncbi:MAG TPA: acetoacetyl-CoA reductase [Nevskiaceae bacterium]|nr:acetoacetyl-CoA reductase [Nevskiaceae bacterium]
MSSSAPLALVTGALGAIGAECLRQLIATGHRGIALDHPAAASREAAWREDPRLAPVPAYFCDLADAAASRETLTRIEAEQGPVSVLVNAAGITRDARFSKMSVEQWRAVLGANLDSAFNACHPLFPGMCARGFGRIINLSSVNGQKGQFGQTNYAASKAGLHGFTMSLAQEGAACGVTVNTVSPGYVATPMTAAIKPEALERVKAQIPLGRLAEPREIARVVAFLAEADSAYLTGANIPVNGGLYMSF